jgi:hypothetical protein
MVIFFLFLVDYSYCENQNRVVSPNGIICAELIIDSKGIPGFTILFNNVPIMKDNRLGLIREDANFTRNLKLTAVSSLEKVEDHYILLHGKKAYGNYLANKKVFQLMNQEGEEIKIIFQVSNDGIAFRYYFPEKSEGLKRIINELTFFNFDDSTYAWIQPIAAAKTGWNAVNPSYEEHYISEIVIRELPDNKPGWVFPALFKSKKYWISLTETAPDRNYCACRLVHDSTSTGLKIGFPQEAEVLPGGPLNPESQLPWSTPWRIITITDNLGTLIESTLGTDMAKPSVLSDISFVKPGRSSWSWVLFKDDSTIFQVQKRFIDYASEMGWEYCLIDADWDRKIGYEKLGELCNYARSKGVGITAWYNSAGSWNTTPYAPRDKLLTKELRDVEFAKLKKLGVMSIKVDFFGGDGQSVMSYYQDIIEDAARYGLMVNCHGSTFPRGWERTYPNLISMEGIRGFEYVTFEQLNADREAAHCTVVPFTRNLFDPMDFTPVCFSEVPNIQRKTTSSFELALSVIFLSGIQHYAEVPEGMAKVPTEVKQIMRDVPVDWDESKFVDGYPGKHIVIARRKGEIWYIAGINGEEIEKRIEINIGLIKNPQNFLLITCGNDNRSFNIQSKNDNFLQPIKITLKPNDGFLLRVSMK